MSGDPRVLRTARQKSGIRDASAKEVWRLLCCGVALPSMCSGELRKSGEPKAGSYPSVGSTSMSAPCGGMMWADNYWMFSDNREKLTCMVNDIIEELLDLDLQPKPESLWWTSTHKH